VRAGFSQVDLLAVLLLLVFLGLLLTPALARTRVTDQAFQCRNNLRRLLNAWRMYAEDNSDKMVSAYGNTPEWMPSGSMSWTGNAATDGTNPYNWNPEITIKSSPLWPYCGSSSTIWRCPGDVYSCLVTGQALPRVRDFSMNAWFNSSDATSFSPGFTVYRKVGDCLKPGPAKTFVFLDERVDSINDGEFMLSMLGYPQPPAQWILIDYPASYHEGAGSFAFVDGHTEIKKWVDPRTTSPLGKSLLLNVPSPNNRDVYWLMDHSTRKP
jgi:prepilin-type processing-associated H-X9-DG protein